MALEAGLEYIDEIVGLPGNAKDHDIGVIGNSVGEFGYIERVVINRVTGHCISGNGRVEVLLGMYKRGRRNGGGIPDNIEVGDGGRWLVPVDYVEIEANKEVAAAIALNRAVELGGWDEGRLFDSLEVLVSELGEGGLAVTGFDASDMQALGEKLGVFGSNGDGEESSVDDYGEGEGEKVLEEAMGRWGVQLGDVWVVGDTTQQHVVCCGDCRLDGKDSVISKAIGIIGVSGINGAITSPPYANQRRDEYGGIGEDEYLDWWQAVQANVAGVLAQDGCFFVNIKPHSRDGVRATYVMELALAMVKQWDWCFIDEFCWERVGVPGDWPNRFKNGFEPIYQFALDTKIKFYPDEVTHEASGSAGKTQNRNFGNYYNTLEGFDWSEARPSNRIPYGGKLGGWGHPAMFPAEMPAFFMKAFSEYGDVWLDPFCGVGSSLVACVRTGRTGIGIEIEPKYVAVTLDRLQQETGQTPQRV